MTISIAAYQVENYLEKTLTSLLLPEILEDIEVLVVDDGSTDRTAEIGRQYQEKYPKTVRLIQQENGGHGATIERGIREASGMYFKMVDGDDWVDRAGFVALVNYLKENDGIDIVSTPYDWVDHHTGKVIRQIRNSFDHVQYGKIYPFTQVCDDIYINMHAVTYRTQLIQEYMPPIDHHCFYVDAEYVLLPIQHIWSISFLEQPVYQYRLGIDGQSMNLRNMQKNCSHHERVLERILQAYKQQRDTTAAAGKNISGEEAVRKAAICRYLAKGAAKLLASQIKIYLSFPASKKEKARLQALEYRIQKEYPEVYKANINQAVKLLRASRYILYLPACWMVRRKQAV